MNIVAWLETLQRELEEAGQSRVSFLIDRIPELTHDGKREQAEALLPEALSAAKALKNAWLEIYFRHWGMRNRLNNNGEGETALAEVVELLELAHREENLECPQSVCVTHDISGCYANIDGPGWAEDRKAVCEETLTRVTPSWPCYTCMNREYVDALMDQERYEEALSRLDALESTLREHGEEADSRLLKDRALVFKKQSRYAEALELLDRAEDDDDFISSSGSYRIHSAIMRASLLAHMGRGEEAVASLPPWSDVPPGQYPAWVDAAWTIVQLQPEMNTWLFGTLVQDSIRQMLQVGAHRSCLEMAEKHARLALGRGAIWTAKRALQIASDCVPLLRLPQDAELLVERLSQDIDAFPKASLPVPAAELLSWLEGRDDRDPEQEAEWFLAALQEFPGNVELTLQAASAMEACKAYDAAVNVFTDAISCCGEDDKSFLVSRLLLLYLDSGMDNAALELAEDVAGTAPELTHWARARVAERAGRWNVVLDEAQAALGYLADNVTLLRMTVTAARQLNRFEEAVAAGLRIVRLAETEEDMTNARWELMTSASAAADWKTLRAVAQELDIELDGEDGPPEEDWGWVRLRFLEDADWQEYYGLRTGPATARVISIANPGDIQHVRDWVVFDPSYIEQLPEDEEERAGYVVPHHVVHVLESAGYTAWICDGADPGEEEFDAFCAALDEQGYAIRLRQREGYTVRDPNAPEDTSCDELEEDAGRLPGIYFAIATPPGVSAQDAYSLLLRLTAAWEHPLCFYSLAKAAGGDVSRQQAIAELYEL